MTIEQFDVVKVPFPFTELPVLKRRPALVLSDYKHYTFNEIPQKSVLAMITSSLHKPWPLDCKISDLKMAGLSHPSIIRMKVFTIDNQLILDRLGTISNKDKRKIKDNLKKLYQL